MSDIGSKIVAALVAKFPTASVTTETSDQRDSIEPGTVYHDIRFAEPVPSSIIGDLMGEAVGYDPAGVLVYAGTPKEYEPSRCWTTEGSGLGRPLSGVRVYVNAEKETAFLARERGPLQQTVAQGFLSGKLAPHHNDYDERGCVHWSITRAGLLADGLFG